MHGAELLKELQKQTEGVEAFGIGGPALQAAGLRCIEDARSLLVMGGAEILLHLPRIFLTLLRVAKKVRAEKPDLAIVLDYPDFHFRLARKLKASGIPTLFYIPPKIWVWRRYRARILAERFAGVLCILPFEREFYQRLGMKVYYVGNPLQDELSHWLMPLAAGDETVGSAALTRRELQKKARIELGFTAQNCFDHPVVALMPGSRPSELEKHFDIFLQATQLLADRLQKTVHALIPLPQTANIAYWTTRAHGWFASQPGKNAKHPVKWRVFNGQSSEVLVAADAGLIKSGTSTLEAGLLGCPHAVVYKPAWLTGWLFFNLVRFKGPVGLVNLVNGWLPGRPHAFEEILCENVTPDRLADSLQQLIEDPMRRDRLLNVSQGLRKKIILPNGQSPSSVAAQVVLGFLKSKSRGTDEQKGRSVLPKFPRFSLGVCVASGVWSVVNKFVHFLKEKKWIKSVTLDAGRVVSVGNLQVGGAGKTPLVAHLAREAIAREFSVCILTRGYRGKSEKTGAVLPARSDLGYSRANYLGDEAALLASEVPQAWIGVGRDRVATYKRACEQHGKRFDWVILDDGFQHWKINRSLDILALTSAMPSQTVFRDFPSTARRAHLTVWTKGAYVPDSFGQPMVQIESVIPGAILSQLLQAGPVALASAVADPADLERFLQRHNLVLKDHWILPDHSSFKLAAIDQWLVRCKAFGWTPVITGKDWVKWRLLPPFEGLTLREGVVLLEGTHSKLGEWPKNVWVIEPEFKIIRGAATWSKILWGE